MPGSPARVAPGRARRHVAGWGSEYDADGSRVVKREANGGPEVLSLGDEYERTTGGDESPGVRHKFRIFAAGREVAQLIYDETTGSPDIQYLHRDQQSSVLLTTNAAGEASEVRDFDVFGEPVATPAWTGITKEAFTGHQRDVDLGLVNAGARLYDATFGVFASADPLRVSGAGSQGFNPYAYANNDPVNLIDPTGLQAIDDQPVEINPDGSTVFTVYGCRLGTTCDGYGSNLAGSSGAMPDFLNWAPGGDLSRAELEQIPSGYQAPGLSQPNLLTRPEFHIVDTSKTLEIELMVVMGAVNLAELTGAGLAWLSTRAFVKAGEILSSEGPTLVGAARGACANGLCPCFVAGTLVDGQDVSQPIEVTRLGARVGPELKVCADTDFSSWREVDLTMTVDNAGTADELELRLLRPTDWLVEQGMLEGRVVRVILDDLNVSGNALVTKVGNAGHVVAGTRCPVTGWVRHTSRDVIAVALEGGETLEVTRHHRLFSADRSDWVHAGDLVAGEALQTKGGVVRVITVGAESLPAAEVFNLEVFGGHQYFVGEHRVLAHNTYGAAAEGAEAAGATAAREAEGIVAANGTRIVGYTRHGLNRAIGDGAERAGTKASSIMNALKNPKSIKSGGDDMGRPFEAFKGSSARVVVNPETRQIVSVNPIGGVGVR